MFLLALREQLGLLWGHDESCQPSHQIPGRNCSMKDFSPQRKNNGRHINDIEGAP